MALIFDDHWLGSKPSWQAKAYASEVGRTDSSVTITLTLHLKVYGAYSGESPGSSWYGYNINMHGTVDGTGSQNQQIKGSGRWYGSEDFRTFTMTFTTGADLNSKNVGVSIVLSSSNGGQSCVGKTISGSLAISARNTAPTWTENSITLNIAGTNYSDSGKKYIIPENINSITVTSPNATDAQTASQNLWFLIDKTYGGNTYQIKGEAGRSIVDTDVQYATLASPFSYRAKASDGQLSTADYKYSPTIMKNKMNPATVSGIGSIGYSSTTFSFTIGAASNHTEAGYDTLCDSNFSYNISCVTPGVTIHNGSNTPAGTKTISIGGTSGIYVDKNELINLVKSTGYIGSITVRINTINSYGSSTNTDFTVNVDLRATASGSISRIDGAIGGAYYPAKNPVTVVWSAGGTNTGETVTYDLQFSYDNSTWITAASNLTTTSATINNIVPNGTSSRTVNLRVGYKTSAGVNYATSNFVAHYWAEPTIVFTKINRASSSVTAEGYVQLNSSNGSLSVTSSTYTGPSTTPANVVLSGTGLRKTFSIQINGLTPTQNFVLTVAIIDTIIASIGNHTPAMASTQISGEIPMFSIEKAGVAVNQSASQNGSFRFVVNGNAQISGELNVTYALTSRVPLYVGRDTRDVVTTPANAIIASGVVFDFKRNTIDGLNDGGAYHGVMTYRPYGTDGDFSGGPSHQLGFTENGNLFIRSGSDKWGAWRKVLSGDDAGNVFITGSDIYLEGTEIHLKNHKFGNGLFVNENEAGVYEWAKGGFGNFKCKTITSYGGIVMDALQAITFPNFTMQKKSEGIFLMTTTSDVDFCAKDLALHYTGDANFYFGTSGSGVKKFRIGPTSAQSMVPFSCDTSLTVHGDLVYGDHKVGHVPDNSNYYDTDLNNLVGSGWWAFNNNAPNSPVAYRWGMLIQLSPNGQDKFQMAYCMGDALMYKRAFVNNAWNSWKRIHE